METPQDLIKPVPPSPGGKNTSRGPIDVGRSNDGGTEFAEAMRSARESARADVRETQAPERQPREAPEETSDEPVYASKDKDLPSNAADAPAAQTGTQQSSQATGEAQAASAANASGQQPTQVAAAPVQSPVAPIAVPNVVAPVDAGRAADDTIQAIAQAAATTPVLTNTPVTNATVNNSLQEASGDLPAVSVPTDLAAAATPRAQAPAASDTALPLVAEATPLAVQAAPAVDDGSPVANNVLPGAVQPLPANTSAQTAAAAQATQVALAPAPVALAVDRAIGNAIVSRPATGNFKPADLAAQAPIDPARIANAGFVAVALNPQTAEDAAAALSPLGEPLTNGDTPEMSAWFSVRPDSLAMALAERALAQDPTMQLPVKLDQALQSLDGKLLGMVGSNNPAALAGQSEAGEPLGTIAALADAQTNQAMPVQGAGMPADTPEPVTLSLNAPMQQATRWATEFGDRMAWIANNRFNSATLQINPPQLGPIEVRIQMSGDQAAVSFAAVQPQTREAIQQALPVLASSLASQGLSLGQTSVGRDHLPQQGGQGGSGSNAGSQSGLMAASISAPGATAAEGTTRGGNGLVDTFV